MSLLNIRVVTPPVVEPVTVALCKQHCRVDAGFAGDDQYLAGLAQATREFAEQYMGRAIYQRTLKRTLDHFPLWANAGGTVGPNDRSNWPYYDSLWSALTIDLPFPSAVSVSSITYVPATGSSPVTLDSSAYALDNTSDPGRIVPTQGNCWPSVAVYLPGSVVVTYVAGSFGDGVTVDTCPQSIKTAILMLVGHWYAHREAVDAPMAEVPLAVKSLLDCYRVHYDAYRPL